MKSNIKDEILQTAKLLFNQQGYEAVSMRDIARTVGISVGNLTYHFPRKADILLALLSLSRNPGLYSIVVHTLSDFDPLCGTLVLSGGVYSFYCRKVGLFWADDELKQNEFLNSDIIRQNFLQGLKQLVKEGYFKPEFTPALAQTMGYFMLLSHYSWAQYTILSGTDQSAALDRFVGEHWAVLAPYFSEKGTAEFHMLAK